jgi:acetylornithine deacetylase/succinyl-diaminopimelate desuccinylase-like protein
VSALAAATRIDGPRFWSTIVRSGEIGPGKAGGLRRLALTDADKDVHGETAHTGPTPMDRRRNALVGAAMLAVAVNEIGWKYHATEGKATAARLVAWPNKAGILSEYAQLTCDMRHAELAYTAPGVDVLLHAAVARANR